MMNGAGDKWWRKCDDPQVKERIRSVACKCLVVVAVCYFGLCLLPLQSIIKWKKWNEMRVSERGLGKKKSGKRRQTAIERENHKNLCQKCSHDLDFQLENVWVSLAGWLADAARGLVFSRIQREMKFDINFLLTLSRSCASLYSVHSMTLISLIAVVVSFNFNSSLYLLIQSIPLDNKQSLDNFIWNLIDIFEAIKRRHQQQWGCVQWTAMALEFSFSTYFAFVSRDIHELLWMNECLRVIVSMGQL